MTALGVLVHQFPEPSLGAVARRVESLGFDSIWTGDHLLSGNDGLVASAALAAATEQIRIGTAVYLPHLRPTVAVARMVASVAAAGGNDRFTFGVGVGGDVPAELEISGVDPRLRGALLDEFLTGLRGWFDDPAFADHGPLPPIWTGGRSVRALDRALEHGNGFAPYLVTPAQFASLASHIPSGRTDFELAVNLLVAIDSSTESGAEAAQRARPFGLPPDLIAKHVIAGSPTQCAERLAEYVASGAQHVIVNLAVPSAAKPEQLELLVEEVRPALRANDRVSVDQHHTAAREDTL